MSKDWLSKETIIKRQTLDGKMVVKIPWVLLSARESTKRDEESVYIHENVLTNRKEWLEEDRPQGQ